MSKQPEQILEEQLVEQLQKLNYSLVHIKDEKELLANLKHQLEKHNNIIIRLRISFRFLLTDYGYVQ